MKKGIRLIAVISVIIAIAAFVVPRYVNSAITVNPSGIATSGFIEATDVSIAAEVGGRIISIAAAEGDQVKAGDIVVKLDASLLSAQKQQAAINLNLAEANLEQSTLARDNAQKAWENGRDVQLKIAQVNLEEANNTFTKITYPFSYSTFALDIPAAVGAINDAKVQLKQAQTWLAEGPTSENYAKALDQFRQALDNLTTAQDRLQRGEGADVFLSGKNFAADFWTLRTAQLEMNKAQLSVQNTAAAVDQAHTSFLQATNGVGIAQEQVKQAEAALELINVQLGKLTVSSPISGVVAAKNVEVGEIAQAGAPVLTVTKLDNVTLTAYVPDSQIGLVMLGQKVQVSVDSYSGQVFNGQVTYISPRAAFTPGNVQLKDEREKTVFAVKIRLANSEGKLKPGMPADATIITNP